MIIINEGTFDSFRFSTAGTLVPPSTVMASLLLGGGWVVEVGMGVWVGGGGESKICTAAAHQNFLFCFPSSSIQTHPQNLMDRNAAVHAYLTLRTEAPPADRRRRKLSSLFCSVSRMTLQPWNAPLQLGSVCRQRNNTEINENLNAMLYHQVQHQIPGNRNLHHSACSEYSVLNNNNEHLIRHKLVTSVFQRHANSLSQSTGQRSENLTAEP